LRGGGCGRHTRGMGGRAAPRPPPPPSPPLDEGSGDFGKDNVPKGFKHLVKHAKIPLKLAPMA